MRKEEAKWQKVLWIVFMLLFSITATAVAAYIYGNSLIFHIPILLLKVLVSPMLCSLSLLFPLLQAECCRLHYMHSCLQHIRE